MKPWTPRNLPLLQQQVGNLLHARVWLQAMGFGAVRNGHGSRQPEVDPTRGPPPNQGSQGSPLLMEGWKVDTFWMVGNVSGPTFGNNFSCFFLKMLINDSLNRRNVMLSKYLAKSCVVFSMFICQSCSGRWSLKTALDTFVGSKSRSHDDWGRPSGTTEPRHDIHEMSRKVNPSNASVIRMVEILSNNKYNRNTACHTYSWSRNNTNFPAFKQKKRQTCKAVFFSHQPWSTVSVYRGGKTPQEPWLLKTCSPLSYFPKRLWPVTCILKHVVVYVSKADLWWFFMFSPNLFNMNHMTSIWPNYNISPT